MSDSAPQEATLTKVMDFVTKFMRPLNFIFGGATIAWGVINLLYSFSFGFDIILRAALSCAFTCILGLLLLVGEIPRLGFVKDQCKFLIICLGRGLFDIFIGGWIYSLPFIRGQGSIIEILFVITWIVTAISFFVNL